MALARHTMGNDWGGRKASNPPNARRVTAAEVRSAATEAGVQVKRDGVGWTMWWVKLPEGEWRTLANTNFLALSLLQRGLKN